MKYLYLKKDFLNDNFVNLIIFKNNFYYLNFCFYKYNKFNKNKFIKFKFLKNFRSKSFIRDKKLSILKKYFNNSIFEGKKEFFFNNFNNFIKLFLYIFIKKNNFFNNYVNYNNVLKLVNLKKIHFDFSFFIKEFIYEYNSIFDIKIIKIPKKYKLKFKKNFNFELVYVYRVKRLKYTLKLLNNYIKKNNNFKLEKKLFWTFVDLILDPKNSFLWKRKIHIYNRAMKKFFKKDI